jgi:adenine/guanine phosphoribosyltransferase-like PRPP-binding protein
VAPFAPDIVVGLPTLGLTLATETARRLGHSRLVPLGTSRKFWYLDDLSMPMSSVTSPDQEKRLYLDPRMIPLLEGRRILLVDDVLSTGASMAAGIGVLRLAGVRPVAIGAAMLQTDRWRAALAGIDPALPEKVLGVISTPRLVRTAEGGWQPGDETI